MSELVSFSDILSARRAQGSDVVYTVSDDWGQGRTLFGGFLSALAVQAIRDVSGNTTPLRALQTNFLAPVATGELRVHVQVLRQGKSVAQIQAQLFSGEELVGLVIAILGAPRASTIPSFMPEMPKTEKGPEELPRLPFFKGMMPNFLQHLDMRYAEGGYPFSGTGARKFKVYVRPLDSGISAELATVMLTDCPPTPMLTYLNKPTPASSVSWALEMRTPVDVAVDGWWRIDIDTQAFEDGYTNEAARLWAPNGQVASFGYQVVAVYG